MKKFSQINESGQKPKINIQDNTLGIISKNDLETYLEITDKFISDEAKAVIKYLIDNNDTYAKELGEPNSKNPLYDFYANGVPSADSTEKIKELYKNIGLVNKKNRLMEIPVFQTKDQFEAIISRTESPDQVILDLDSERGRNEIAKKYEPLIHKLAKQFLGKSNLTYDELVSAGYQGLTWAMNGYGKKTTKNKVDLETVVSKTFTQYAAYIIRVAMLEDIKHLSQTVRIPLSQQNLERQETGRNTKSNTISGDKEVGTSDDSSKALFDYVGATDNATRFVDQSDVEHMWSVFYDKLEEHFADDKTVLDIYYHCLGLKGYEKIKKKELADKYGVAQSMITYVLFKVNSFIKKDKRMMRLITDIFELMSECKHDEDMDYDPEEGLHIKINDESDE